jgi:hypothetical protein
VDKDCLWTQALEEQCLYVQPDTEPGELEFCYSNSNFRGDCGVIRIAASGDSGGANKACRSSAVRIIHGFRCIN